jgi:hypothetical protein
VLTPMTRQMLISAHQTIQATVTSKMRDENANASEMATEPTAESTTEVAHGPSAAQTSDSAAAGTSTRLKKAPCYTRFHSPGSTVFNWKEGNHSLPSPTYMVVTLPLNVGQSLRAAN